MTLRGFLRQRWQWIVFPVVVVALNAVLFRVVGDDEAADADVRTIEVGRGPQHVAVGAGGVWVSGFGGVGVSMLDPTTERVEIGPVFPPGTPGGLVVVGGDVWVGTIQGFEVARIDAERGEIVGTTRAGRTPASVSEGFGYLWVAVLDAAQVARIDLESSERARRYDVGLDFPSAVATGFGSV
ncbi:MAG: hypothetical protein ACRDJJ_10035, partial [Actinomycetota bacterium]